ncbi:MAG: hypothetical protein LBF80_06325 [Spirochaetaceae bacterium]|jgi:hypothetical protein|nr:hypothetical protein [Spirochaetaceae bacterium]
MKKIIGVFWHGQYNLLCAVRAELLCFIDLRLYSSQFLDDGAQKIDAFFEDCSGAALILLYTGAEVRCREEIEARIERLKILWKNKPLKIREIIVEEVENPVSLTA